MKDIKICIKCKYWREDIGCFLADLFRDECPQNQKVPDSTLLKDEKKRL